MGFLEVWMGMLAYLLLSLSWEATQALLSGGQMSDEPREGAKQSTTPKNRYVFNLFRAAFL